MDDCTSSLALLEGPKILKKSFSSTSTHDISSHIHLGMRVSGVEVCMGGRPARYSQCWDSRYPLRRITSDSRRCQLVKSLGKQYLWVDSVCINQSDEMEKLEHMGIMSDIYGCAYATIVALSGASANAGLPRVGPNRSAYHPKLHAGWKTSCWTRPNAIIACVGASVGLTCLDFSSGTAISAMHLHHHISSLF